MKTQTNEQKAKETKINCPTCGRRMEVGFEKAGQDFYAQCRNRRCGFDGANAPTIHELKQILG